MDFEKLVRDANEERALKHTRLSGAIADAIEAYCLEMRDDVSANARTSLEVQMSLRPGTMARAAGIFGALQALVLRGGPKEGNDPFLECESVSDLAAGLLSYAATVHSKAAAGINWVESNEDVVEDLSHKTGVMTASVLNSIAHYLGSFGASNRGSRQYDPVDSLRRLWAEATCLVASAVRKDPVQLMVYMIKGKTPPKSERSQLELSLRHVWHTYYEGKRHGQSKV